MNHVIIGNGPTGIIAAETLRKEDPQCTITVIGDEPELPYSRMAIPYYLIGGIDERGLHLRKDEQHFRNLKIDLIDLPATRVDAGKRQVLLKDGQKLDYDKLLIATGSKPASAPIPGIDLPGVHSCWTLDDARHIAKIAKPGARVVQMGAGFIGCIILEALASRGVELTVIEMGNRMVPRMMTDGAGSLIKKWCEKKGVKVYTATKVTAIEKAEPKAQAGGPLRVKLDNGKVLDADLVISATGVRPNIEFLKGTGIKTEAGVLVDADMQTNIPGIYAAGDVAQATEFNTGHRIVNAIQPNAADQALVAARNMAGKTTRSQGTMAINVLDTMGLISSSFGQWMGVEGGDHAELTDAENFRYLRLEFKDDVLIGATSLGLTEHVGVIRGLIQSRLHLREWKELLMQDPTRFVDAYIARSQGSEELAARP
ncbi:MAG: NAD(P)/FAD-dependent oxidoreductase [Burkholderiales bacterium]|nr:NAD(P)/FAD-dependent oxidoreductase [Burkholderiales bacterium]MDQ3195025.1 FAD-dependent oxidoreductase [Pseudomonadota bacterium]